MYVVDAAHLHMYVCQAKANSGFVTTKRSEANYSEKIRYTMQTEFFSETYDVLIGYEDRCKPMRTDGLIVYD